MGFSEKGGTRNVQLNTATTASDLHQAIRTIKSYKKPQDYYFLRAESFYNVATYMKQVNYLVEYGGDIHLRSHGEAFLKLLTIKLKGKGLYLLDEPEAALSPTMLMTTLSVLDRFVRSSLNLLLLPILLFYWLIQMPKFISFRTQGLERYLMRKQNILE